MIKRAWQSKSARKATWTIVLFSFVFVLATGSWTRQHEQDLRETTLTQLARTLASTALSGGNEADDMLLKVNDLLNVESVLGVKLLIAKEVPLSVGETTPNFPPPASQDDVLLNWLNNGETLDSAIRLDASLPFDWIVLRLDAQRLVPAPMLGTLVNWVFAPLIALGLGLINLWAWARLFVTPHSHLRTYLQEHSGKFASTPVPQELLNADNDIALTAKQIEALRDEIVQAKNKADFQARFLHETPYALLRCSVNRKVLYANAAARAQKALFGDESKEFVAPALSELVRKAFYESKQVFGDVRCKDQIITFRAIPVLDAGYVNLYGEVKRHIDDDV